MPKDVVCSLEEYLKSLGVDRPVLDGIPTWMAMLGVVLIVLVSHRMVNARQGLPQARSYPSFNLLRFDWLKRLIRKGWFPSLMQSASVLVFLLILTAGLFGREKHNIVPVLTWTWWWALLIFLVLGFGQTFCMICPWEAISSLVTSLSLKSRIKKVGFEKPWPRWARHIYPAILFFIILTWFELGNDVTHSASMTAVLALVMLGMAVLTAIYFERRAFCRNACLVGRITGLYSLFSPVELRPQSAEVCADCATKDCHRGNERSTGCPTKLFPGNLHENTYCTLCTECIRACPHDNLVLRLRPPASDLLHKTRFQWDEALLAVVLLALTSFHGFTMTPLWVRLNNVLRVETGLGSTWIFTLLMLLMLIAPVLLFWAGAALAQRLTRGRALPFPRSGGAWGGFLDSSQWTEFLPANFKLFIPQTKLAGGAVRSAGLLSMPFASITNAAVSWSFPAQPVSVATLFKAFAYALIPVALFYHLAHNCMHFFLEAGRLFPLLSDPMGWGWNLFGTAGKTYEPLLSLETIWILQILLIVVGHVYGVRIADRIAKRLFNEPRRVALSLIPLLFTMILYSSFSVWLISQPMEMRTGM